MIEEYVMTKIKKEIHRNFKGLASLKGKKYQDFVNEVLEEYWETKCKKELLERGKK